MSTTIKLLDKDLKKHTRSIKASMRYIKTNYINIAYHLTEIDRTECYLDDGFMDTIDYSRRVLGMGKSTTYNLLRIGYEFIRSDGKKSKLCKDGVDYSSSQLVALLSVGLEEARTMQDKGLISPDMSVRKIRSVINPDKQSKPKLDKRELALQDILTGLNTLEVPEELKNNIMESIKEVIT